MTNQKIFNMNKSNLNCVNTFCSFTQGSTLWLTVALVSPWQIFHLLKMGSILSLGESVSLLLPKMSFHNFSRAPVK